MFTVVFLFVIHALLVLLPPVAMWRMLSRRAAGRAGWFKPVLALTGPVIAVFVCVVLLWLPAYSGQCGGWLGETTACGFGQYATETAFWAAMSMAMPAGLGILLGGVVLGVGLMRRGKSRRASRIN